MVQICGTLKRNKKCLALEMDFWTRLARILRKENPESCYKTRSSGKNKFTYFPYISPLFEVLQPKLMHWGTLEWHHLPTKFHENVPNSSKDIHISFIPKAFRLVLPYSKQLAPVSMVTSAVMSFLLCNKLHALITIFTSAKDCMSYNHGNQTVQKNPKPLLSNTENHASNSHLWTSTILKWLKLLDQELLHQGPPECHHLLTKFH
jgi:hypothetical protein